MSSLHALLAEAAARYPERLAVAGPAGELTYGELDRAASQLAAALRAAGAGRGDRVVVWADKSPLTVAAMQAVLRIGAAYVPADGSSPADRVALIARDCGAAAVCSTRAKISGLRPGTAWLDLADAPPGDDQGAEAVNSGSDELAYILYTSGSTGVPKGVCVSHGNARAFVDWAAAALDARGDDRFANHAPLTFDLSVLDLYCAFSAGASVHLVPTELGYAPVQLSEFLRRRAITVWYSVPSALTLMMRGGGLLDRPPPPSLRVIAFAGEPFPIRDVRALRSWTGARLLNLYGPTETNVCTAHEVTAADLFRDRPAPIGRAASGDTVWAEKPDRTRAGPGEEGELVVTGPTVMLGYWGRPRHRGPYRTGDLVRVLGDGSFDYVGRRDHRVKVRGNRVELGEIEAWLGQHPWVAEVAAVVCGSGIEARLTAYVVAEPERRLSLLDLKRHCAVRLSRYMIPDDIHLVASLPKTRNGKTDRAALAAVPAAQTRGVR